MENSNRFEAMHITINEENQKMMNNLISGFNKYISKTTLPEELLSKIKNTLNIDSATNSEKVKKMIIIAYEFDDKKEEKHEALSQRENEVLSELTQGKQNKQIAETLSVSKDTIHFHKKNIYKKLNVHSPAEATAVAFREGLIQ